VRFIIIIGSGPIVYRAGGGVRLLRVAGLPVV